MQDKGLDIQAFESPSCNDMTLSVGMLIDVVVSRDRFDSRHKISGQLDAIKTD